MMTTQERYMTDPVFHRLVNVLYQQLVECNMTATEIREAAIFAAQKYEMTHFRPLLFPTVDHPERP